MDPKLIIQARIDELQLMLSGVVTALEALKNDQEAKEGKTVTEMFKELEAHKDNVLALKSAIAELKYVKELL